MLGLSARKPAFALTDRLRHIRNRFASLRSTKRARAVEKRFLESQEVQDFVAVLSHELRNSLGGARNAARVLRVDVTASPSVATTRLLLERQLDQMTRLIEDLTDLSQIRSGQLPLRRERIDLCALLGHCARTVEFTVQQCRQQLNLVVPGLPVWLHADPTRLEQAFVNLLINATKYTPAGGSVTLAVEQDTDEAIVRVRDTGIGIEPGLLPRVFDLFMQANSAPLHASVPGRGVGLAVVRVVVESHGGKVTAASAGLAQGTEFTVRLPKHS